MSEERFVLFSPIGGTDPMSPYTNGTYRDGSMLHICRKYRPEHIVLYLSGEMVENHNSDDRYRDSIRRLAEEIGFSPEIEIIERPELIEVQIFDNFYNEFSPLLNKLHENFPEHTLLLNISSGTPAMKSALNLLAMLLSFKVVPVQVTTPFKRQNPRLLPKADVSNKNYYDTDVFWKDNQDRRQGYEDRCSEVASRNLNFQLRVQDIKAHLRRYDYEAALTIAGEIKNFLSSEAMSYLKFARNRIRLDWTNGLKNTIRQGLCLTYSDKKEGDLPEYLLWLQMKQERGDLADFLRGITPALFYLLKIAVEEKLGYGDLEEKYVRNGRLLVSKLGKDKRGRELLELWTDADLIKDKDSYFLNSNFLTKLLEQKAEDRPWLTPLLQLRSTEANVRNQVAHQIVRTNETWVMNQLKSSSVQQADSSHIMQVIKDAVEKLNEDTNGAGTINVNWESYREMNAKIEATLVGAGQ